MVTLEASSAKTGEKSSILVHEDQLFDRSPVFKAAFERRWKESADRSMVLPDHVDIVEEFVSWLYSAPFKIESCDSPSTKKRQIEFATQLYVFADKYQIDDLKDAVCTEIYELAESDPVFPSLRSAIYYLYANTSTRNALRRLFVDWIIWYAEKGWFEKAETWTWIVECGELNYDLMIAMAGLRDPKWNANPFECGSKDCYLIGKGETDPNA